MDNISPIKPITPKGETDKIGRTRPDGLPKTDKNFKKIVTSVDEGPSKEEEEVTGLEEEEDHPPSLFDLATKHKLKKSTLDKSASSYSSLDMEDKPDLADLKATKQDPLPSNKDLPPIDDDDGTAITSSFFEDEETRRLEEKARKFFSVDDSDLAYIDTPAPEMDQALDKGFGDEQKTQTPKDMSQQPLTDRLLQGEVAREAATLQAKKARPDAFNPETDATVLTSKKDKGKLTASMRMEDARENSNLSAINPNAQQAIHFNPEKVDLKEEDSLSRSTIKEIAAQLIDHIYTVRKEGRTDTVVTLRYPPLLEGATVTLSTQEGAKREFNIAFANLTEAAKQFLDRKLTEDSLTATLERKGITVLALTTTTLPEISIPVEAEQYFGRGEREQQQQRQQQRQQDLEEENT